MLVTNENVCGSMLRTIGFLFVILSTALCGFAQAKDESVFVASWAKGLGRIEEVKLTTSVSRDKPVYVSELRTESGQVLELQINYRPMDFLERDHWIVQLFDKEEVANRADLFNVEKPGTGGDQIRGEGRIRYLYPEDERAIRFNKDKLITEGRVLFFDPLKRPRIFKFEEFEVRIEVRSVEFAPDDTNEVLSMEIDIEAKSYRK